MLAALGTEVPNHFRQRTWDEGKNEQIGSDPQADAKESTRQKA